MMPTMTREQFEAMDFTEFMEWAYDNIDDVTTEETLLEFVKTKITDGNIMMACHVLNAVYDSEEAYNDYYLYDYSMGTLETPTPITCKEDLEDYIDFEEDDKEDE